MTKLARAAIPPLQGLDSSEIEDEVFSSPIEASWDQGTHKCQEKWTVDVGNISGSFWSQIGWSCVQQWALVTPSEEEARSQGLQCPYPVVELFTCTQKPGRNCGGKGMDLTLLTIPPDFAHNPTLEKHGPDKK
ncbi:hypothetical protein E5288_WYG011470 [Bos mutus]|uniref:Uncharacterized protein n=1 Tax=Bos mutus TaxID=72004 RepID=A0A6B0S7G0_9CETA|nr:hypothetical protein [Bos mutus]